MTNFTPRGWKPGLIEKRFANTTPTSYDAESRTVDCVISRGSPVARFYGTEVLRIAPSAVVIDRLAAGGIPLLDSHQQTGIGNSLGRFTRVWFSGGALMGKIAFNATAEGRKAEGMVKRGEITGISAGYSVREWEISDEDGTVIDPEKTQLRWDDTGLTFTATLWELLEGSLVTVPADASASVRSMRGDRYMDDLSDIRARMNARQLIHVRQSMYDRQARVIGHHE
jgi:Caudovirus prohead serine protease